MSQLPNNSPFRTDQPEPFVFPSIAYQPHIWKVKKDDVYMALLAITKGIQYARECLTVHENSVEKETYRNKVWANKMLEDIVLMERSLLDLNKYDCKDEFYPSQERVSPCSET